MKKVFVVGLSKTGTTSLHAALELLGYRSIHNPTEMISATAGRLAFDAALASEYDALSDLVIAGFYSECDAAFPGSKFILTTRDVDRWIRSCANHFDPAAFQPSEPTRLLCERVYGTGVYDEAKFRAAYRRHDDEVRAYFSKRPQDLLVVDLADADKWGPLCRFLGVPEPRLPYPHENKATPVPAPIKRAYRHLRRSAKQVARKLRRK